MTSFECREAAGSAVQRQPGSEMLKLIKRSRLVWPNFVKVRNNWIQFCNKAYIGTYNRRVKFRLKCSAIGDNYRKTLEGVVKCLDSYCKQ